MLQYNSSMTSCCSQLCELLRDGCSLEDVTAFVQEHPESVTERDETTGRLALHNAVEESKGEDNETLNKVALLLCANPKGAAEADTMGKLPLHLLAAQSAFRPLMLHLLLKLYGGATIVRDSNGSFPLHIAIVTMNFETAMLLLREYVGAMDGTVTEGFETLLQLALDCEAPDEFIRLLADRAPEGKIVSPSHCFE